MVTLYWSVYVWGGGGSKKIGGVVNKGNRRLEWRRGQTGERESKKVQSVNCSHLIVLPELLGKAMELV